MRTWRPNGWETLKAKNHPLHCFFPDACVGESFEAGAAAMLKALQLRGKHFQRGTAIKEPNLSPVGGQWMNVPGTVVFIPDEDEKPLPETPST